MSAIVRNIETSSIVSKCATSVRYEVRIQITTFKLKENAEAVLRYTFAEKAFNSLIVFATLIFLEICVL